MKTLQLRHGQLSIAGWSFPNRLHPANPLLQFPDLNPSGPILGLLHGDLEVADSRDGPLRGHQLDALPVDKWVLGHIHAPSGAKAGKHFYCGSPLPLRTTEQGAHGCWLLEYQGRTLSAPVLLPSPVRVDALEVLLDGTEQSLVELHTRISEQVRAHVLQVQERNPGLRLQYLQLRISGESVLPVNLDPAEFEPEYSGVQVRLTGPADNQCLPPIPMAAWASQSNVRGRLARMFLALQQGQVDAEGQRLLEEIRTRERQSRSHPLFSQLEPSLWSAELGGDAWARELLRHSLRAILAQIRAMDPSESSCG